MSRNKFGKDCKGGEECYDDNHLCKIAGRKEVDKINSLPEPSIDK